VPPGRPVDGFDRAPVTAARAVSRALPGRARRTGRASRPRVASKPSVPSQSRRAYPGSVLLTRQSNGAGRHRRSKA
jgi:hypothetical protein